MNAVPGKNCNLDLEKSLNIHLNFDIEDIYNFRKAVYDHSWVNYSKKDNGVLWEFLTSLDIHFNIYIQTFELSR